jgi:hypothetical protein
MEYMIGEIDNACTHPWQVAVTPRIRGPIRGLGVQTTILMDDHGEIAIVCFDPKVSKQFRESAPLGRRILLCNCEVIVPDERFRVSNHRFELVFGAESRVMLVDGTHNVPIMRPCYLGSISNDPVDVTAYIVYIGSPRHAAFVERMGFDIGLQGARTTMTLRLTDALGACSAAGGIATVLQLGQRVVCRNVKLDHDSVCQTDYTSVHPVAGHVALPITMTGPWPVIGVAKVEDEVRRTGAGVFRVRAVMTWHTACGAYGEPRRWTVAKRKCKGSGPRSDISLYCHLRDSSGLINAKIWNVVAVEILGGTVEQLLQLNSMEFDSACEHPMYRELEWTLSARPSPIDDTVYLNVDAVDHPNKLF